jgi:membrane-associated HD superfamily phosphohydrolase
MIDKLMDEGQLNDAPISLKDIAKVKEVFIGRLKTIYHARIAYPTEEEKEEKKEEGKD